MKWQSIIVALLLCLGTLAWAQNDQTSANQSSAGSTELQKATEVVEHIIMDTEARLQLRGPLFICRFGDGDTTGGMGNLVITDTDIGDGRVGIASSSSLT